MLKATNYLIAERVPSLSGVGSGKALLKIGPVAKPVLAELLGCSRSALKRVRRDSALILPHHLAICDVRVSLELACQHSHGVSLGEWMTERELRRERSQLQRPATEGLALVPDASFTLLLNDGREQTFWLEMDMGTMSSKRLLAKMRGYLTLGDTNIPILFCCLVPARAKQLLELAQKAGAQLGTDPTIIWSAAKPALTPERILNDQVWLVAGGPAVSVLELTGMVPSPPSGMKGTLFFRKAAA